MQRKLEILTFGWGTFAALGLAVVAIGAAVICVPARAGIVTRAEYSIVHRPGLTAAERRAITISSVTAASDPSLGLIVTATFQGNIERYLGQGDLRNAVLALVLEPGAVSHAPTEVIEQGGGFLPAALSMLVRHGKRMTVTRRTVDLFGAEHVLRTARGGQYGVIRDGDEVVFHIASPALVDVRAIRVKVFVKSPLRFTTTGADPHGLGLARGAAQAVGRGGGSDPRPKPAERSHSWRRSEAVSRASCRMAYKRSCAPRRRSVRS